MRRHQDECAQGASTSIVEEQRQGGNGDKLSPSRSFSVTPRPRILSPHPCVFSNFSVKGMHESKERGVAKSPKVLQHRASTLPSSSSFPYADGKKQVEVVAQVTILKCQSRIKLTIGLNAL
jgi:hypothetical protein